MELFRILATMLVLITHLNGWLLGGMADTFDSSVDIIQRIGQLTIASLTVVCVNCFLIISGWYGVKLKFSSLWKMWTLLVCIYIPFQLVESCYTGRFSIVQFADNLLAFTRESYFVQCYLMLLFLSPMVNSFVDKFGKRILPYALVFWCIEFLMESVRGNKCLYIENGYSLIHFMMMYLLARAASFYKEEILNIKRSYWLIGYLLCAAVVSGMHLAGLKHTWAYSNPVVVVESFCLFFPFLYTQFYNSRINTIAASTFAVFIMHTCSPLITVISKVDVHLLKSLPYWAFLMSMFTFAIILFVVCIVYDMLRIKVTSKCLGGMRIWMSNRTASIFIYE